MNGDVLKLPRRRRTRRALAAGPAPVVQLRQPAVPPTDEELEKVVGGICARVMRLLHSQPNVAPVLEGWLMLADGRPRTLPSDWGRS